MSACQTCHTRRVKLATEERDLYAAARRAARKPTPAALAALEVAKAKRDEARQIRDEHDAECEAAA